MDKKVFIARLFGEAKKAGLADYEAYFREGGSFNATVFGGAIEGYNVNTSAGLSFRALVGDRMGYSYTEAFDDSATRMLVERAVGSASVIENEDPEFIFSGSPSYEKVDSFNEDLEGVAPAEKIEMAKRLEAEAKAFSPDIRAVHYCSVLSSGSHLRLANSKGLDLSFRSNRLGAHLLALAMRDGTVTTGMDFAIGMKPGEPDIGALAVSAAQKALDKQGATSVSSGTYDVALHRDAAAHLVRALSSLLSAEEAQKGKSMLLGREGTRVSSPVLTIIDDPLLPGGYASRPFDDEGVACRTKAVVEDGILKTLLHNLKTAAKAGGKSTGNAAKADIEGAVGIAPSNLYIKPGELSFEALLQKLGSGLLITELDGLHAGVNPISGDFSLSARGFRVEGGERTAPVEQIVISGSLYELVGTVEAVGSDLKFGVPSGGAVGSPTLLVRGMTVAGE